MTDPEAHAIVALASPPGESALAIIRVSGSLVPELAAQIFPGRSRPLTPRMASLCTYQDVAGQTLDQLVAIYYENGRSFTGEPMLELMPHGNPFIVQRIIEDLCNRGVELAEPGAFSRLAFLNGKMDLSQAEAIMDVVRARSDRALQAAQRQLQGRVGERVNLFVSNILRITAHIEAYIDFPEDDLPDENQSGPVADLLKLISDIGELEATSHYSTLLHEGIKAVIAGEPNVGKSSLLNALTGEDRVIVSDTPGTTRDYVEDRIHVGPYLLRIIDTAGIHAGASEIESMGIERSLRQLETADLVLLVVDCTRPTPEIPDAIADAIRDRKAIVVQNKADLTHGDPATSPLPDLPHATVSAMTGSGLDGLRALIRREIESGLQVPAADRLLVSARHATALAEARTELQHALDRLRDDDPTELAATHLHLAIDAMGQITGRIDNERMLDELFAAFCIGK